MLPLADEPPRTVVRRAAVVIAVIAVAVGLPEGRHVLANAAYGVDAPICRTERQGRTIALSFDDGPSPEFTPRVLALLGRYGARATFFDLGSAAARFPDLIRREIDAGMEIGDHTWSHPRLSRLPAADIAVELNRTRSELRALGASAAGPMLFRPPYGDLDPAVVRLARKDGFVTVLWSLAVEHYTAGRGLEPGVAAERVAAAVRPGDIVLAHDGGGNRTRSVETLARLLPMLEAKGYAVVTVGELLGGPARLRRSSGRPWFWQRGLRCPDR